MPAITLLDGVTQTLVDEEDYEKFNKFIWHRNDKKCGKLVYVVRSYYRSDGKKRSLVLHREIMNCPEGMFVDHINHNTLDNRKCNLRIVTCQQNNSNSVKWTKYTSKFKGVSFDNKNKKWLAQIQFEKKKMHIGRFNNEEDAAREYDKKAKELFGEYACLNFKD